MNKDKSRNKGYVVLLRDCDFIKFNLSLLLDFKLIFNNFPRSSLVVFLPSAVACLYSSDPSQQIVDPRVIMMLRVPRIDLLVLADLVVHRLDELEFFFQRLTLVLGVDVLQRLIVQILRTTCTSQLYEQSRFHY